MRDMLGDNIKKLRRERGVTQSELADAVGVSVQAVSKWECGGTPDVALLPAIADYFEVSIDILFGRDATGSSTVDELIQREIEGTPREGRIRRSSELMWDVFKAMSGIPSIYDLDFAEPQNEKSPQYACTRARFTFDDGMAYCCATADAPSFFVFPEPENGYGSALLDASAYASLFSTLADEDVMKTIMFLLGRRAVPFSSEHVASYLSIPECRMKKCLAALASLGWLEEEQAELESGLKTLYRPIMNESFVAFLYYAAESLRRTRLWYLSNANRREPILRGEDGKQGDSKKG